MKTKYLTLITLAASALAPLTAFAACPSTGGGLCNPIQYTDIYSFLTALLSLAVAIAFPVIVLFIVYIGFLFVTAAGKPEEIQKARKYFFWAIIGALIVLGAEALSLAIQATVEGL